MMESSRAKCAAEASKKFLNSRHEGLNVIIHHHPSSSIIIHHHPSSSIIIHHHPSSTIIIHHRPKHDFEGNSFRATRPQHVWALFLKTTIALVKLSHQPTVRQLGSSSNRPVRTSETFAPKSATSAVGRLCFNTFQYLSIPSNTFQYLSIPFNTFQYLSIPFNSF